MSSYSIIVSEIEIDLTSKVQHDFYYAQFLFIVDMHLKIFRTKTRFVKVA